jgi:hypothetical protein
MPSRPFLIALMALSLSTALSAAPAASPRKGSSGRALGIFLGQPTGLSFRYGLGQEQSLEAKAAWDLSASSKAAAFSFQANWLMEFPGILTIDKQDFPLYTGAGLQVDVGAEARLGFRIPGGICYRFAKAPIELCLEVGLGMQLIPSTSFLSSGGFGLRYRF